MDNKEKLKEYIDKILGYVCGDIEHLKNKRVTVSFPYIFLCFSGIDFLGGLEKGFRRNNSRFRSSWFISTWMSKVNTDYSNANPEDTTSQASYLYKFARSGLFHMACVQRSVIVETNDSWLKYHLHYEENNGDFRVFIHPLKFAEEFLEAKGLFLEDLYSEQSKIDNAFNNINEYFQEIRNEEIRFVIPNLFHELNDDSGFDADTQPSGSESIPPSGGTQAPN